MLATAAMAILPLLVAIVVARSMLRNATERFYVPEIGSRLDQSLGLYQELAKTIKQSMRHAADAIAARQALRDAASKGDAVALRKELSAQMPAYPGLVSLTVTDGQGDVSVEVTRGRPVDEAVEKKLEIERSLSDDADNGSMLRAVFVTDRARLDELEAMGQFLETYRKIEKRRFQDEKSYVEAFAVLLALTVLIASVVGLWLARGPTVRLTALATAIQRVGSGDLATRVSEAGKDEISDLARAFNRMVAEIESSRARIEYLQRIGAWQEMARRLAHEIKNPLTPIQLAVQEVHRRCPDGVPQYQRLVNETLQIVEDEVETLRHLVSEFSSFARMPQASLKLNDLGAFLRKQERVFQMFDEEESVVDDSTPELVFGSETAAESAVKVSVVTPERPCPAYFDAHMFKRVVVNLVRNAVQAILGAGRERGNVTVTLASGEETFWLLDVDDDGPGIPDELKPVIFDPYVTTKRTGTGLGLAIVKKIIIEHGGTIDVSANPSGGARLRIRLPKPGSAAAKLLSDVALKDPSDSKRDPLSQTLSARF
jgi:nitrogen fixation/metabolism regulation signal transduction histidine kinase